MSSTDRVSITTYIPANQREKWKQDAQNLDMSQSEFVRTMVQAGRRGFSLENESDHQAATEEGNVQAATPGVEGIRTVLLKIIRNHEPLEWDEIRDHMNAKLGDHLKDLENQGQIRHDGPNGGYHTIEGINGK